MIEMIMNVVMLNVFPCGAGDLVRVVLILSLLVRLSESC